MLTTSEGKIDRRAWWMLIVLTAIYTYSWLDRQIIVMLVDPIRHELGLTDFEMSLILGPAQGLRYAVVTLEGVGKGKAVEKETVHELDNIKCRFSPHVQAATVGQFVVIKNSDPILHTAHAFFTNEQPQFNVGLYAGRVTRKPLIAAGIVKIHCEVHPWMTAYIVVTDHPYHAISDIYGEYELTNIPPGAYQLKVWHESLGTQEKRVEVKPAITQKVDFTFTPLSGVKK